MSQRESLSRWLRTTEQEKRALSDRRVVSGLARTGQVSRSTVMLAEEDVAIEDALGSGVDAEANNEMTDENLDLSDDATDAISDFQDDTDWMGEEEFESRADDSEEMINLYQNLDEAEQQRLADKAELEEKFADFDADMSDASGRIDAARDRADEAFGKAETADLKATTADGKASSAQTAADTANTVATTANQKALEALGLASTGKVWVQDTAPPKGKWYRWLGAVNNSVSVEMVEDAESRRNLFRQPIPVDAAGFNAFTGQTSLSVSGGVARWTIQTTGAVGINLAAHDTPVGQSIRILLRVRSSRSMVAQLRVRGTTQPSVPIGVTWQWVEATLTAGSSGLTSTGLVLIAGASGHQVNDWIEIDRVLLAPAPGLGDWFGGGSSADRATDLWIDTTGGANTPSRFVNGNWVEVTDKAAKDAAAAAVAAKAAADAAQSRADEAHSLAGTAQSNAQAALTMAGTKSRVYYSTDAPSGTGTAMGDLWRQRDSSQNIIAEWYWSGTGWVETKVSSSAISNLDVGKLTVGTGVISDLVAQNIAARAGQFIELDVGQLNVTGTTQIRQAVIEYLFANVVKAKLLTVTEKIITQDIIADGAILARMLSAGSIDGMTITGALIRTAASGQRLQIDINGLRTFSSTGAETARLAAASGGLMLTGALVNRAGTTGPRASLTSGGIVFDNQDSLGSIEMNTNGIRRIGAGIPLVIGHDSAGSNSPLQLYASGSNKIEMLSDVKFSGDEQFTMSPSVGSGRIVITRRAQTVEIVFEVYTSFATSGHTQIGTIPARFRPPKLLSAAAERRSAVAWFTGTQYGSVALYPDGRLFIANTTSSTQSEVNGSLPYFL